MMPSKIKKRFTGFLRQISSNSQCTAAEPSIVDLRGSSNECFITKYLNGQLQRAEVPIEHGREPAQLPELRLAPLQPPVFAAYTGPAGGLTAVAHRAEPVSSAEPGISYIDSDDSADEPPPPAPDSDGTSLRARLARLHYRNQRLAGNLTLPSWVPVSPPVQHGYRIRLGDLQRYKSQTLPARRCFSDDRLDEEDAEAELLQTMMTSLCSTCSDSLPNLTSADGGLDSHGAASLELLLAEDLFAEGGTPPNGGSGAVPGMDVPSRAEPESSYIGGRRRPTSFPASPLVKNEECETKSEMVVTSPCRSEDGKTPTNDDPNPTNDNAHTTGVWPSPDRYGRESASEAAADTPAATNQENGVGEPAGNHALRDKSPDLSLDVGLGESMDNLDDSKDAANLTPACSTDGEEFPGGLGYDVGDSSGVSSTGCLFDNITRPPATEDRSGATAECVSLPPAVTVDVSCSVADTGCAPLSSSSPEAAPAPSGKAGESNTSARDSDPTPVPSSGTISPEESPLPPPNATPVFSPRAVSTPEKCVPVVSSIPDSRSQLGKPLSVSHAVEPLTTPDVNRSCTHTVGSVTSPAVDSATTVDTAPADSAAVKVSSTHRAAASLRPAASVQLGRSDSGRSRRSSGRPAPYRQYTQPDECLARTEQEEIAGTVNWNRPHARAFGSSVSLYECHPITGQHAGEPIADAFGLVGRSNSALLALADGVNWGEKARLAARCAVHGCLDYLSRALFGPGVSVRSTQDVFASLLRSFHVAHGLILSEGGMLTTLTAAVVAPCHLPPGRTRHKYVVCVCNVGDSLAYVFSERHGVREITKGSHDINSMRDMRDALGALGPVAGQNPELNNLTLSMTQVDPGDIVFLTSDGVSDNFDPVVGKFVLPQKAEEAGVAPQQRAARNEPQPQNLSRRKKMASTGSAPPDTAADPASVAAQKPILRTENVKSSRIENVRPGERTEGSKPGGRGDAKRPVVKTVVLRPVPRGRMQRQVSAPAAVPVPALPVVTALQRHELTQLRMDDLLRNGALEGEGRVTDAKHLCCQLLDFAFRLTTAKRRVLEDPELYTGGDGLELSRAEQRSRRRRVCEKLAVVPGKLDHATVVAYQVGEMAAPRVRAETAL